MGVFDFITGMFEPVTKLVDEIFTSDEERGQLDIQKQELVVKLESLKNAMASKYLDYEMKLMEARSSIIIAETKSDSWLTRSWRPIVMVTFLAMVVSYWMGYTPSNITEALLMEVFLLIKIGLGGYLGGRTIEKIGPAIANALKKEKK